jgi:hypothetical protein
VKAARTLALALLGLAAAGCSVGGGEDVAVAEPGERTQVGRPDPAPGRELHRFLRAGRRADMSAMWALLSRETRAGLGGTLARFRGGAGADFAEDFELVEGERVNLSRRLGRFGVAAIAGLRPPDEGDDPEEYALAAAFVRERAGWRLELGGVAISRLQPGPLDETDDRPVVGARADAAGRVERLLVWLDGRPFRAPLERELVFSAELEARPARPLAPGLHHVVVFAQGGGAAAAGAWPFIVE